MNDLPARPRRRTASVLLACACVALLAGCGRSGGEAPATKSESKPEAKGPARPALTVTLVAPQSVEWPQLLTANGNIVAWQEAVIGAELTGLRITDVLANVGDTVRRGQPLAKVATEAVAADLAQAKASLAEAEAALSEAEANARRSKQLQSQGFISPQATIQALTTEQTAGARVAAARARVQSEEVRMAQTRIVAPDDGVVSARTATVGSLTQPGQELFRLIRGGRLEWRAEVTATELARLAPGTRATLTTGDGQRIEGRVRAVAPAVDPATRNGLVYVDVPAGTPARAGTFARGEFETGRAAAQTLPQSAVVLRDGFAYVFVVDADGKAAQSKVTLGRRVGDRVEIVSGLPPGGRVVETGAGFLADGDTVKVVAPAAGSVATK
jgi:RND family efflux transporter MFP subunit